MQIKDGVITVVDIDGSREYTFDLEKLLDLSTYSTKSGETIYYLNYSSWEDGGAGGLDPCIESVEISKEQYEELKNYAAKNMLVYKTKISYRTKA